MPRLAALWSVLAVPIVLGSPQAPAATPAPAAMHRPDQAASSFRVVLDPALQSSKYTGRVYLVLSTATDREPRFSMLNWFGDVQILALDVAGAEPGAPIDLSKADIAWPKPLAELKPGDYRVQAVARRNLDSPEPGGGPGDLYSDPLDVSFSRDSSIDAASLTLNHVVAERPFRETDHVKLVSMVSPSLSAFAGREVRINAGVILPEGWKDDAGTHYPTLYWIGGFGGTHFSAHSDARFLMPPPGTPDVLIVVPDPSCHFGHSVFADSANNGPRGKALIEELIPEVEKRFHGAGSADRRFVSGISSGGWSSLWLQVTYPDQFNGVWSHCPDPVDFRDFQRIDLYTRGSNMYRDERAQRRPLARRDGQVVLWYDDFVRREDVLGDGGQIRSFEAVFSPRGKDGRPVPLFDRESGTVNTDTARAWEPYDIRLVLERNWPALAPRLAGKIHVYAGGEDTFFLDGSASKLKQSLEDLGSDAVVEVVPGMPHTVIPDGIRDMWKDIARRAR